jgi:hypothetical protein
MGTGLDFPVQEAAPLPDRWLPIGVDIRRLAGRRGGDSRHALGVHRLAR